MATDKPVFDRTRCFQAYFGVPASRDVEGLGWDRLPGPAAWRRRSRRKPLTVEEAAMIEAHIATKGVTRARTVKLRECAQCGGPIYFGATERRIYCSLDCQWAASSARRARARAQAWKAAA
jgi:hypothetical protein